VRVEGEFHSTNDPWKQPERTGFDPKTFHQSPIIPHIFYGLP